MPPFSSLPPEAGDSAPEGYARSIRRLSRLGYATAALGLLTFATWATVAEVSSAVIAKGTVSVASTRKSIEHLTGGIVSSIDVEEGQPVRKNQLLLTLDATETTAQVDILRVRFVAAYLKQLRLRAEAADDAAFELSLPTLQALAEETGEDAGPRVVEAFDTENRVFRTRRATQRRQAEIYENQKRQFDDQARSQAERIERLDAQIRDAADQVKRTRKLVDKGIVSTAAMVAKQGEVGELEDARAAIAIQLDQARSSLDGVELERLKADQTRQEEVGKQLAEIRGEIGSLRTQLGMERRLLKRTEIRSPQDGVVQNLHVRTLGAVVAAGTPIMEIVPIADELVVSMQLPVNHADQVQIGMPASLRFPGLQSSHTLRMDGTVRRISPDAVPDEQGRRTIVNGEVQLDARTAPKALTERIRPGIEAEIVIPTAERSVASFLTKPLADAFTYSMRER